MPPPLTPLPRCAAQSEVGVLVTTYDQLRLLRADLLGVEWGYVVLDEGHKIRCGWAVTHWGSSRGGRGAVQGAERRVACKALSGT